MMLHGAPRTSISSDLLITRYLLWIEQFARFEMRGEMNRTQPALNLRDGLGLGGEQVRGLCHGNSIEHALRAKARQASCRCDGILPLCGSFGPEDPQCGSGDEVALKVEGVVNRTVHAEEALGGSCADD